jgi:hypothetical protein
LSVANAQTAHRRDPFENRVPREQNGVAIDRALRNVSIGRRHRQASVSSRPAKLADLYPMVGWRLVNRDLLDERFDGPTMSRTSGAAHQFGYDDGRQDDGGVSKRFFEKWDVASREEVDPD